MLTKIGLTTNIFQWYDFLVFAYLAKIMGKIFFDTNSTNLAMVSTFAVFAISYLIRPIGSIFWGYIGDRYSIEKVIKYTIVMMSIPTIIIGVLPTYSSVGIISPICLIILRLVQGFAAGGELPSTASHIYNKSSIRTNKTLLCCLPTIGSMSGSLIASLTIYILFKLFDYTSIINWAWRIPFLLGLPLFIIIMQIRSNIKIIPHLPTTIKDKILHKQHLLRFFIAFILTGFLQICFYTLFVWMPSYLEFYLKLPHQIASSSNILGLITAIISTIFFGFIAR